MVNVWWITFLNIKSVSVTLFLFYLVCNELMLLPITADNNMTGSADVGKNIINNSTVASGLFIINAISVVVITITEKTGFIPNCMLTT